MKWDGSGVSPGVWGGVCNSTAVFMSRVQTVIYWVGIGCVVLWLTWKSGPSDSRASFKAIPSLGCAAPWNVLSCSRSSNGLFRISRWMRNIFWTATEPFFSWLMAFKKWIWRKAYFQPVDLWLQWLKDKHPTFCSNILVSVEVFWGKACQKMSCHCGVNSVTLSEPSAAKWALYISPTIKRKPKEC